MKDINIFDDNYIDVLCPNNIEYIWDIISFLDFKNEDITKPSTKRHVLKVLKLLFELKVLYVHQWLDSSENRSKLTINETIDKIDSIWFEGAQYPDFYNMVMFGYEEWYKKEVIKLGFTQTTNWIKFVKKNIGGLDKWIYENKPK